MDLVNSVTLNSNNKNVTMENQSPINNNQDENDNHYSGEGITLQMKASPELDTYQDEFAKVGMAQTQSSESQLPDYLRAIGLDPKRFWPKKYRFTREKAPGQYNPLSIAQRNFYECNGYLIIDKCNPLELIEAIRASHEQHSLKCRDDLVDKLVAKNEKLLQYVRCFCDERTMLMTHELVESFHQKSNRSPEVGFGQSQREQLVRDWIYLPFRPIDKVVCAITAIKPIENIILVVPGTHKVGQCTISSSNDRLDGVSGAYETSQEGSVRKSSKELFECLPDDLSYLVDKSGKPFKFVDLKPGQTLFYHPGLVHGFSNDLVNFRKCQLASVAYYAAADCEYVEMKRQPTDGLRHETDHSVPIGLRHFGDQDPGNYNSWLNRPRLVQNLRAGL